MVNGRRFNGVVCGIALASRLGTTAFARRLPRSLRASDSITSPVVEDCNYCFCNSPEPVNACIAERWAGR
jgi:hypothetical protein